MEFIKQIPGTGDREEPLEGQDLRPKKPSGTTTHRIPSCFLWAHLTPHLHPSVCVCPTFLSLLHGAHGRKWPTREASKSLIASTCTDSVIYSFICSFNKYSLGTYYIPGPVLDVGYISEKNR